MRREHREFRPAIHERRGLSKHDLREKKKLRKAWAVTAAAAGLVLVAGGVYGYSSYTAAEQQRGLAQTWAGIARGLESTGGFIPGFDLKICPVGVGSNRVFFNETAQNGVHLTRTVFFPISNAPSGPLPFQLSFDMRETFNPITLHRRGESWTPDRGQSLPVRHVQIIEILNPLLNADDETIQKKLAEHFGDGNANFDRQGGTNFSIVNRETGVPNVYRFRPGSMTIESGKVVALAGVDGEGNIVTRRVMTGFSAAVNACAQNPFTGGTTPPSVAEEKLGVDAASAASRIRGVVVHIRP